ncbi:MAG: chromate resistance protein ChrB domain-containing protein [Pseudomonadota bacterium]
MPGLNQIAPAQPMRLIGTPEMPVIVDVRAPDDFAAHPYLIPTARCQPHKEVVDLLPKLDMRRVVVVCQRGLKLSEGAAALLRTAGIAAETLEGGTEAWAAAGLPMVPAAALPASHLWATRHRPKIDRIACPWAIRRFVDPAAEFLFVAPSGTAAVADRFDATPFDIEGVRFSHRGAACTFDAVLDDFGLHTEALDRLALVVRAADTDRHDLAPQAAGLLAISVGLSRQFRDDLQQLEAGMVVCDALYRWARDGHDEGHDWPAGRKA